MLNVSGVRLALNTCLVYDANGQLIVALGCIGEKSGVNDAPKQDRPLFMAGSMLEKYHICGRRELVDEYSVDGYVTSCHRFWKSEKRVVHDFFRPGSLKSKLHLLSKVNDQNEANYGVG